MCIYITVEFKTLRTLDSVGLQCFRDWRSGCGAKIYGVGAHAESEKYDPVHLCNLVAFPW